MSRGTWEQHRETHRFRVRGSHPLWPDFPDGSANDELCDSLEGQRPFPIRPATPAAQRSLALTYGRFGLVPVRSPLLGESLLLSLPEGT